MNRWKRMSPFTRLVIVGVLVGCVAVTYHKQRYIPLHERLAAGEEELDGLRDDLDDALLHVERLRMESRAAERWAGYAMIIDRQTTGRSFHDILARCGGPGNPKVSVRQVEFERIAPQNGFPAVGVRFQLQGRYGEIMEFLHLLDDAFPPVELSQTHFTLAELDQEDERAESGYVMAQMEGVLYEPH